MKFASRLIETQPQDCATVLSKLSMAATAVAVITSCNGFKAWLWTLC